MHISRQGLDLIKHFEGFRAEPYICSGGERTIGYGHIIRAGDSYNPPISKAQAERLLRIDVAAAEAAVRRLLPVTLTQAQYDALVSFTYNLGAGALQRSTLRQKVLRGHHQAAGQEFLRWVYAGGRKLKGLMKRRQAEAELYLSSSL
jgi:lysozyme